MVAHKRVPLRRAGKAFFCILAIPAVLCAFVASASAAPERAQKSVLCRTHHAGRHHRRHGKSARSHHGRRRKHHRGKSSRLYFGKCSVRSLRRHSGHPASGHSSTPTSVNLASLASANCPDTTVMPVTSDLERARAAIFCLINRERARNGEDPLRPDGQLRVAAQHHSDDMLARNYFDHEAPGGETLLDRLRSADYIYSSRIGYVVGENIAWGTLGLATPKAIVEAWMASPGHRANILDASFRETGIGITAAVPSSLGEGQPGAMYTQDFGVILGG